MTTMVSPVPRGQSDEFMDKLEAVGLNSTLAQRVIDSPGNELAEKVVRLIENGWFEPTMSQKRAREIMGKNFFGVEEAIKHFGVNPSRPQLAALAEVPWGEEVLTACKDTHVLVAVLPLSILEIRGKVRDKDLFYGQDWYNQKAFASDRGEACWQLIHKTPVIDSTSKTWSEQQALLADNEVTPSARVMVYTIIGHYLATGERLFEYIYVRCSDVGSDGSRVSVGDFDSEGLYVYDDSVGYRVSVGDFDSKGYSVDYDSVGSRSGHLGVSSARKF